jgi:hypothetical protein
MLSSESRAESHWQPRAREPVAPGPREPVWRMRFRPANERSGALSLAGVSLACRRRCHSEVGSTDIFSSVAGSPPCRPGSGRELIRSFRLVLVVFVDAPMFRGMVVRQAEVGMMPGYDSRPGIRVRQNVTGRSGWCAGLVIRLRGVMSRSVRANC